MLVLRRTLNRAFLQNCNLGVRRNSTVATPLNFDEIKYKTKVPAKPIASVEPIETEKITIDKSTLELLERLSLCNLSDKYDQFTLYSTTQNHRHSIDNIFIFYNTGKH